MLDELAIENIGLIDSASLSLDGGLTVITGETGTGKTMLVGGLRLLLGQTARRDIVGPHGDAATVEGRFLVGEEQTVGRRVVTTQRSRAYLNGSMATADQLQSSLGSLVDIVAQHDQLALRNPAVLRGFVDVHLDDDGRRRVDDYAAAYGRWRELQTAADELGGDRRALERESELASYQAGEIDEAALYTGLEEELLDRASRLRHREELLERFGRSNDAIDAARESLGQALDDVRRAAQLDQSASETAKILDSAAAELSEASRNLVSLAADLPHDPEDLAATEAKLADLGNLKRKYGDTVEDIISFGKKASARARELAELLERAETLEGELQTATLDLESTGEALRVARRRAAQATSEAAVGHLRDTGMTDPLVAIEILGADAGPEGADRCELRFASDSRLAAMPVQRVASGGELSRLVLALRLAARGSGNAPVMVFDEVDAGVGGETGLAVGRKLAALSSECQVLCVTHLPQVAAFADQHFVVERSGTNSTVREVTDAERAVELARMLSGMSESGDAQRHASELLAAARGD